MLKQENGNAVAIILIVIILVLGVGLVGVLIKGGYINLKLSQEKASKQNETVDEQEKTNKQNENIPEKKQIKIDENKNLVYDVQYPYKNLEGKSYTSETIGKTYSLNDIVVPYININSEDAMKANEEIKNTFEEMAESFKEELETCKMGYTISNYKMYTNNKVLSLVITVENWGGTDVERYNYYTYNFDLDTLELMSYENVYKKVGFTKENIDTKVKDAIKNFHLFANLKEEDCESGKTVQTYINASIQNYISSVNDKTIRYFIDGNNDLNVVVNIESPVGAGEFIKLIKVKK